MKFQTIRQRVVDTSLMLADHGYFAATGGNLAFRVDDEHFVVTPSAVDYYQMTAANVCVLRLRDLAKVEGDGEPSVETGVHAQVLRGRPDCQASIHTHQPLASACSLLGQPLPVPREEHQALLGAQVLVVGYSPSGTSWLASKLGRALRPDVNAYLFKTHGALCCGASVEQTLHAIVALEVVAHHHLREQIARRAETSSSKQAVLQHVLATLDTHPVREMIR